MFDVYTYARMMLCSLRSVQLCPEVHVMTAYILIVLQSFSICEKSFIKKKTNINKLDKIHLLEFVYLLGFCILCNYF